MYFDSAVEVGIVLCLLQKTSCIPVECSIAISIVLLIDVYYTWLISVSSHVVLIFFVMHFAGSQGYLTGNHLHFWSCIEPTNNDQLREP